MPYEYKKPQSFDDANAVWNNEGQAYDGDPNDQTTAADSDAGPADADPWIAFHTWEAKGQTYTETILYVNWKTNGLYSDDKFAIKYTKDGAQSWNDLVALGVHNETAMQQSSVALDVNQDLTKVQVKLVYDKVKGPDDGITYIYDIWTRGEYEEVPPGYPYHRYTLRAGGSGRRGFDEVTGHRRGFWP